MPSLMNLTLKLKETDAKLRELKVGEELGAVNFVQVLDGFHFDDDSALNAQIQPDSRLQIQALVEQWNQNLPINS
jgi:hypothetical protein